MAVGGSHSKELGELIDELAGFLQEYGADHWTRWFERDKLGLEQGDPMAVRHCLSAFGGMGSFNDLVLCEFNGHLLAKGDEPEVDACLRKLQVRTYRLATKLEQALF